MPIHKTKHEKGPTKPHPRKAAKATKDATFLGAKSGKATKGTEAVPPPKRMLPLNGIVTEVRQKYGLSRRKFAKMTGFSERALSDWERSESKMTEPGLRKMREMENLYKALAEVMKPDFISRWLETPNDGFTGATPLEIIERGETGKIWRFIYYLESGMPV